MNPRTRLSLLLLFVVLALGLFLFTTDDQIHSTAPTTLSDLPEVDIDRIQIERESKQDIVFTRTDQDWRIERPLQFAANSKRIQAILQLLQAVSLAQLKIDDVDLRQLRLDNPTTVLKFNEHRFIFGGIESLQGRRYLRVVNTIHLIDDTLYPLLQQPALFFANAQLLRDDLLIAEIAFPGYTLRKRGQKWLASAKGQISEQESIKTVNAWQEAEASMLKPYSSLSSLGDVIVTTTQAQTIRFIIVKQLPTLVLARSDLGLEYHFDKATTKRLFPMLDRFNSSANNKDIR